MWNTRIYTRTDCSHSNPNPWQVQRNRRSKPRSDKQLPGNALVEQTKCLIGRGKSCGLYAVSHNPSQDNSKTNMTGTFVSKLHPRTTSAHLATYIRSEFGLTVRPEKLSTKAPFYSSFYIPSNHNQRQILMNADMWPTGALIKPFLH